MNETLLKLQKIIADHTPNKVNETALDFLTLYRSETVTDPVLVVYRPRIYIVIQGGKRLHFGHQELSYKAGQYLISGSDIPLSGRIDLASSEAPYMGVCISFSPDEIRSILHMISLSYKRESVLSNIGINSIDEALLDVIYRLLNLLNKKEDISFLGALLKKELLYYFLKGPQGHILYNIAQIEGDIAKINAAIIYLKKHFREKFKIDILSQTAGMSRSSFYKKFKEMTHMSPVEFRMYLRLQEARRLMLGSKKGTADAAFYVGYESSSQFIRDYKKIFYMSPKMDIKRLRHMEARAYKEVNEEIWRWK